MSHASITLGRHEQRTPSPVEHDSTASSPHTLSSSSVQQSSLPDTSTSTSSPEVDDRPDLPQAFLGSSSFSNDSHEQITFRPAPSFSIARAPRYPGWNPANDELPTKARNSATTDTTTPTLPLVPSSGQRPSVPPLSLPRFTPSKPLSPNHLARIANALGVQVPTPPRTAGRNTITPSTSNGFGRNERRPASANSNRPITPKVNSATRFLLYVVPPPYLTSDMSINTGPPSHFRRGSLLPLHATLQSQLAAIAREWSLPSTVGLVVYLLDVKHDISDGSSGMENQWLGPRIGDEAWKLLWTGMLKAEREEFMGPALRF